MSRYYQLIVTPTSKDGKSSTAVTWTNKGGGKAILGAQTIQFDLITTTGALPAGGAWVRILGPTKQQIQQASDFNGAAIELYGGMQDGLPLATRAVKLNQAGLLIKGSIIQAFGNWQGITQTLDFVIVSSPQDNPLTSDDARQAASIGAPPPPQNFSFSWKQGAKLTDSVLAVMQQAYPGASIKISAADDIVLLHDESGSFENLQTFSVFVLGISRDIKGTTYPGLNIAGDNAKFKIFDTTKIDGDITNIEILDLVGQVTWLDGATIQFSTVLRADLTIGDAVTFPPLAQAQAVTTSSSQSNARTKNTFSGKWIVNGFGVRHVGDSRAPDAQSWISSFQASPFVSDAQDAGTAP